MPGMWEKIVKQSKTKRTKANSDSSFANKISANLKDAIRAIAGSKKKDILMPAGVPKVKKNEAKSKKK